MNSPDNHLRGFLDYTPRADRYGGISLDPDDVAAKISSLIPRGAKGLDVGCGTGSVSEVIQKMSGARLIGIEPDAERAAAARARGLEAFQGFLSEEFLQQHGPFDVIIFADVLEHLPDPAEVVSLARKGLVPGGSIVASVPNVAHYFVRMALLRGRFDYQQWGIMDATHLRWFTRKTLAEFFQRMGFHVSAMGCTVNINLPEYQANAPWRWLGQPRKRQVVGALAKRYPGLFGCQHIIKATLPTESTPK